jgi:2-desacetyl-2-hydroxyethyl bacteriochlorophyllide A dehydrogenase
MKAVRSSGGGVGVVDVDEPPGHGDHVLDIRAAGICASDLGYITYGSTSILGHELGGVDADGTACAVEAIWGCGHCAECERGVYNLCPEHTRRALGMFADGGMAEQFRAPAVSLVPLPEGLDVRDASLVEPAAVSWHGVRLAGTSTDTTVAVVGAGAVGLLAVAAARHQGAPDVALDARHAHQKEAGERLGARIDASGGTYDVVVEAAGTPESVRRCIDLVAPGGTIVVLGVHTGAFELDWLPLFGKEGRLLPSLGYCRHEGRREIEEAAAMLAEQPEIARTLITHRFPLEDAEEAFRVASDRRSGALRVVLEP